MAREFKELNRPLRIAKDEFGPFKYQLEEWSVIGLLSTAVDVEFVSVSDKPDVIFTTLWSAGERRKEFGNSFVIQYLREPHTGKDWLVRWGDYFMGFEPDSKDHFYFPHWMHDLLLYDHPTRQLFFRGEVLPPPKTDFCAIFSSHDRHNTRTEVFDILSRYKTIDSYGRWRNNKPFDGVLVGPELHRSNCKIKTCSRYKFSFAIENCIEEYYCTEKIMESMLAKTIPLYIGDPFFHLTPFNQNRVLNVKNMSSSELLQTITKLDNDPELYWSIINQPMFSQPVFPKGIAERSDRLISRILESIQ